MTLAYPIESNAAHPARLSPAYRSAVVLPPASSHYSSIDGLLPLHTFRAVSFRQREGYVLISQ